MTAKKPRPPKRMSEEERMEQARRNSEAIRFGDRRRPEPVARVDVDQAVATLTEELDISTERVIANKYHGVLRARDEGRQSALELALSLLTGRSIGDIHVAAETRAMEKEQRTEDARILVRMPGGGLGWAKPWCDCDNRGGWTRDSEGVWVRSCCGRKEKYAWLKDGDRIPRTLPNPDLSTGKGKRR